MNGAFQSLELIQIGNGTPEPTIGTGGVALKKGGVMRFCSFFLVMIVLLMTVTSGSAKIYKYQRDGTWFFTDSPPADMPKDSREMVESPPVRAPA